MLEMLSNILTNRRSHDDEEKALSQRSGLSSIPCSATQMGKPTKRHESIDKEVTLQGLDD